MGRKPFRFGVVVRERATRNEWIERARQLEALGYATLLVGDQFGGNFAPGPALALAAGATTELRIASHVYDHELRHPAVLAKETASLDRLSDGRFEFGVGAGWLKKAYEQIEMPFDAPDVRIRRLSEAVEVVKGLWTKTPFFYHGEHYTIRAYNGLPKPLQQPHPPVFLEGGDEQLLSLAARQADIIGLSPHGLASGELDFPDITGAAVERKLASVRAAAGERMNNLELSILIHDLSITDEPRERIEWLATAWQVTTAEIEASPYLFVGSLAQIADQLQENRERYGISYFTLPETRAEKFAPVVARLAGT